MMAASHAETFRQRIPEILETMVRARHSVDDAFSSFSEEDIHALFGPALEAMAKCLPGEAEQDSGELSSLVARATGGWVAKLLGAGLSPRSTMRAIVSMGDFAVQVVRSQEPGKAGNLLVRDIVRFNFEAARNVVEIFDAELRSLQAT